MKANQKARCRKNRFTGVITSIKTYEFTDKEGNVVDAGYVVLESGHVICHTKKEFIEIIK